ncbi:hypothetical protein DFP72DRAFT_857162 [Ephemerocybe angulata]|uniref:Uncharacterized protein n=1 Tax=Ephemerocybe angulata TaxID=980116 RepID=A0A8H6HF79_9AGAR|nr:hypothetical protein DFP72DRAFT_857162 [Tulosesus angulatus]
MSSSIIQSHRTILVAPKPLIHKTGSAIALLILEPYIQNDISKFTDMVNILVDRCLVSTSDSRTVALVVETICDALCANVKWDEETGRLESEKVLSFRDTFRYLFFTKINTRANLHNLCKIAVVAADLYAIGWKFVLKANLDELLIMLLLSMKLEPSVPNVTSVLRSAEQMLLRAMTIRGITSTLKMS